MAFHKLCLLVLVWACVIESAAQTTHPLVIAWQAPLNTQAGYFNAFVGTIGSPGPLSQISGIGVAIAWNQIDNCSSQTVQCMHQSGMTCGSAAYKWCNLDADLMAYIGHMTPNQKIILIVQPEVDSGNDNTYTPLYVFSDSWANSAWNVSGRTGCSLSSQCPPQDVVVCSSWTGGSTGWPSNSPVSGPFSQTNAGIWNVDRCFVLGANLSCANFGMGPYDNFSGYPVVYEPPIMVAYQDFLSELARHYSPTSDAPNGAAIAPYIAYVRAGMASGGENNPQCTMGDWLPVPNWKTQTTFLGGYIIQPTANNSGNYQYVSDNGGVTGTVPPTWCQTAGCYTAPDGTITRWHNVGQAKPTPLQGSAIWPGRNGQVAQPQTYRDNGYLTLWDTGDGTGYVASMYSFLSGLNASFPWDVSTHTGPPSNKNDGYVEAEALLAAQNGIGFGMQSLKVWDGVTASQGGFPSSTQDWVANFQKYPGVPVHHLQLADPGTTYWWSAYTVHDITVSVIGGNNTATVNCDNDCSWFAGQYVVVTGNPDVNLNGSHPVSCGPCSANTVQFLTSEQPNTYLGGTLYSVNYWPITMPFAVQHGATSLELWECDIDYAFNVTTFDPGPAGCNPPPPNGGGKMGPDADYTNAIQNTLKGQPTMTSVHAGTATGGVTHF